MKEIWKDIEGYEGEYQVSNTGRVRSIDRLILTFNGVKRKIKGKEISLIKMRQGYLYVNLSSKGNMKTKRVNILVAKAFIPNPYLYPIVNHIDLDKENNNKKNLEWTTASENMKHAYRNGVKHSMIGRFGSDHVRSKAVIKKDLLNNPISTYGSIVEAAMDVGVSPNNISNTCNGKRLTSAGYKWEFSSNSET